MRNLIMAALFLFLTGCSKVDVSQYVDNKPELDIFTYFEGQTRGWGIVQDRKGELLRQFVVTIDGTLSDENTLVLDEDFVWNDGELSKRVWTIKRTDPHTFVGSAEDVVGYAQGNSSGNALHWRYQLNIEARGSTWKVHFDDWMFLQPDQVMINRAAMSKFGIHLGDITIAFTKD